jgi:hypothetical protein
MRSLPAVFLLMRSPPKKEPPAVFAALPTDRLSSTQIGSFVAFENSVSPLVFSLPQTTT